PRQHLTAVGADENLHLGGVDGDVDQPAAVVAVVELEGHRLLRLLGTLHGRHRPLVVLRRVAAGVVRRRGRRGRGVGWLGRRRRLRRRGGLVVGRGGALAR